MVIILPINKFCCIASKNTLTQHLCILVTVPLLYLICTIFCSGIEKCLVFFEGSCIIFSANIASLFWKVLPVLNHLLIVIFGTNLVSTISTNASKKNYVECSIIRNRFNAYFSWEWKILSRQQNSIHKYKQHSSNNLHTTKFSYNFICIPESFNTNISHQLFYYEITFTALKHKSKRWLVSKTNLKSSFERFPVYKNKSESKIYIKFTTSMS